MSDYAWPTGGVEEFVREFLEHASGHDVDCSVLTWSTDLPLPVGFRATDVAKFGDVRSAWAQMDDADVVVVVTSFNVRLLARLVADYAELGSTPTITILHTSQHSEPGASSVSVQEIWLRALSEGSACVVAVSDDVADAIRRIAPSAKIDVIENGARLCTATTVARGRQRVSFIGRPHAQKGFSLFEELALSLSGTEIRFRANTVSTEPSRRLSEIDYSYRLDDDALRAFFDETDLLVVPYLRADGLPLAVLEALNCGVPVLGFDSPGVGALLRKHGQAVIEPTFEALQNAISKWRAGELAISGPRPGSVNSWPGQIDRYLELARDASERSATSAAQTPISS